MTISGTVRNVATIIVGTLERSLFREKWRVSKSRGNGAMNFFERRIGYRGNVIGRGQRRARRV